VERDGKTSIGASNIVDPGKGGVGVRRLFRQALYAAAHMDREIALTTCRGDGRAIAGKRNYGTELSKARRREGTR